MAISLFQMPPTWTWRGDKFPLHFEIIESFRVGCHFIKISKHSFMTNEICWIVTEHNMAKTIPPFLFINFFFFFYEWEHRTDTLCTFSSLYPLRKGRGR